MTSRLWVLNKLRVASGHERFVHALSPGKSVVLLESRAIGAGQTARTTAHLMSWVDE